MRTCVGCRKREARTDLVRIVATGGEEKYDLTPDLDGSAKGRGAHLHPTIECFEQAMRRRAFGRALRIAAPVDASAVQRYLETAHQGSSVQKSQPPNGKRSNSS